MSLFAFFETGVRWRRDGSRHTAGVPQVSSRSAPPCSGPCARSSLRDPRAGRLYTQGGTPARFLGGRFLLAALGSTLAVPLPWLRQLRSYLASQAWPGQAVMLAASVFLWVTLLGCQARSLPHEQKSVAQLQSMLDGSDSNTQAQGALGLSLMGAKAKPAVPRLIELLKSDHTVVREQSALALGKIGADLVGAPASQETLEEAAVPALTRLLNDQEWTVRRQAALALGRMGKPAQSALPALQRLTGDRVQLVREAAIQAIRHLKEPSRT